MPITIGQRSEGDFSNPLGFLSACHRRIEQFLQVLIEVTSQARGGALNGDQRNGVEVALRYFREAAPKHTRDEEESLFPRMLASSDKAMRAAIHSLEGLLEDHKLADAAHAEVEAIGSRWLSDGILSSESTDRLLELLYGLRSSYQRHIAIEENAIFPLAGDILGSTELAAIGHEIAERRSINLSALESKLKGLSEVESP